MMYRVMQSASGVLGRNRATLARRSASLALLGICLAIPACSKDSSSGPKQAGPPSKVIIVSGDAQTGAVGQELPAAIVVRVVDANGTPVQGQAINFHVTAGGGSVFAGSSNTNADGVAQERWTLGTLAGSEQTIEARAVDNSTGAAIVFATFHATATPGAATALSFVTPPSATAQVGVPLSPQVVVQLVDKYANATKASGVSITASVTPAADHSVDGATTVATTDQGTATFANLMVRGNAAVVTLTFSAPNLTSVTGPNTALNAGLPASLTATTPTSLTGTVGGSVSPLPTVAVKDASGNVVNGVSVQFAVSTGGGVITPTSTVTEGNGVAKLGSWTLPNVPGTYSVVATSSPISGASVTFTAMAQPGSASRMSIVSGDGVRDTVGKVAPPLVVKVTDVLGNPLQGVTVAWRATTNTGSGVPTLSSSSTATGADGTTQVVPTLQTQTGATNVGVAQVTASVANGPSVQFTLTAVAGLPTTLTKTAGDLQAGTPGTKLPIPIVVKVTDRYGNPVDTLVRFTVTSGGGTLDYDSGRSGPSGVTGVAWTLGTAVGTQTAEARVGGLVATFSATAVSHIGGWSPMTIPTTSLMRDVWGTSPSDVFAVGDNGTILHYDGSSWSSMSSGTSMSLTTVWGASGSEVYASGGGTAILRYNGSSWSPLTIPPPPPHGTMTVASATHAIALYSTNGAVDTAYSWTGSAWAVLGTGQYLSQMWLGVDGRGAFSDYTTQPGIANDGSGWKSSSQFGYRVMAMTGKSFDALFIEKSGLAMCCQLSAPGWGQTAMGSPIAWLTPVWMVSPAEVYLRDGTKLKRVASPLDTQATDEGIDAVAMWGTSSVDLFLVGADGKIYHRAQ